MNIRLLSTVFKISDSEERYSRDTGTGTSIVEFRVIASASSSTALSEFSSESHGVLGR